MGQTQLCRHVLVNKELYLPFNICWLAKVHACAFLAIWMLYHGLPKLLAPFCHRPCWGFWDPVTQPDVPLPCAKLSLSALRGYAAMHSFARQGILRGGEAIL